MPMTEETAVKLTVDVSDDFRRALRLVALEYGIAMGALVEQILTGATTPVPLSAVTAKFRELRQRRGVGK